MPTYAATPSASASPSSASVTVVILAILLQVPLGSADLVEPMPVAVAFDEASYRSTAVAMTWAAAVAVLSKVVMRLKEQGGVPTEEELDEAAGAVAQVADSARAPTGRVTGGGMGEMTGVQRLNGLFGRAKGAQGQDRVPVKEREPRLTMAYLAGLKRIAACTQGDDTAAQALEAAEELLQSAVVAADQDLQMVRDAYEAQPDVDYVFDDD